MFTGTPDCEPGRVDREVGRRPQGGDLLGPVAPPGETVAPRRRLLGGELVGRHAGRLGLGLVDPRPEVGRRQVRERQAQVREVALGVDQQRRQPGPQDLLDQHDAEAGLARAGHADDHAVGREVGGVDARPARPCARAWTASTSPPRNSSAIGDNVRGAYRSAMAFTGFPPAAFEFYEQLEADNSKAFWQANKVDVRRRRQGAAWRSCATSSPTSARSTSSGPTTTCASPRTARRTRRTRVPTPSPRAGPATTSTSGPTACMVAVGYYAMAKDQLERFRAAVDDEATGAEVERISAAAGREGLLARGDGRAEDGAAGLPEGPPADRPAAPQGPHGVARSSRWRRG